MIGFDPDDAEASFKLSRGHTQLAARFADQQFSQTCGCDAQGLVGRCYRKAPKSEVILWTECGVGPPNIQLIPMGAELIRRYLCQRGVYALPHIDLDDIESNDVLRRNLEPRIGVANGRSEAFIAQLVELPGQESMKALSSEDDA